MAAVATQVIPRAAEQVDALTGVVWQGGLARSSDAVSGLGPHPPAEFGDPLDRLLRTDDARAAAVIEETATRMRCGYAALPFAVVPEGSLAELRSAYESWARAGLMRRGDAQNGGRVVAHDDPFARGMHAAFTELVSRVARRPLVPSYAYTAFYDDDASIAPHRDRAQCEITLAVCIGAESTNPTAPGSCLVLEHDGVEVLVPSRPGRAVCFAGSALRHGRSDVTPGARPAVVLLHYVSAAFTGERD